jgi:hypothetical protein
VNTLTYTFDDSSTQVVDVSAANRGGYMIPTNLNRRIIKTLKKVIDFAVLHGVSEHKMEQQAIAAMLQSNMSPLMLDLLDAAQYGAEVRKAQKTKQPGTKPAPLETVGGKSNPSSKKSLEEMDMDEYVAARKAGRKV